MALKRQNDATCQQRHLRHWENYIPTTHITFISVIAWLESLLTVITTTCIPILPEAAMLNLLKRLNQHSLMPPLAWSKTSDDFLNDPEDFSLDELEKEFAKFEKQLMDHPLPDANRTEVLNGDIFDFDDLDWVNQGEVPREDNKVITIDGTMTQATWDVELLMSIKGIAA